MRNASIFVQAFWDDDAKVWVATSNDIVGLSVEGATHEELTDKVVAAVADRGWEGLLTTSGASAPPAYSKRRTSMGSTRVALRAGM